MAEQLNSPPSKICEACGNSYLRRWGLKQFERSRACSRRCSQKLGQGIRTFPPIEEAFWGKVDKSAGHGPWGTCWIWTGTKVAFGYGNFRMSKRLVKAHRFSFELQHGRPVPRGLIVRHRCDNPSCVRPDHLLLGTLQDNSNDAKERGRTRAPRGEARPNAKLTEAQVRVIKFGGAPQWRLAKRFKVTRGCIAAIRSGRTWRHVGMEG